MDRLNLFNFFNNHDYEYYEDNLSRAFALCLKNDTVFLDNVLRYILDSKSFSSLFTNDYPDYQIKIELQKRPAEMGSFGKIFAVACSATEMDPLEMAKVKKRDTDNPETDVSIEIKDTCIIFEFKKTLEDCSAQLKCQAEKIWENNKDNSEIVYIDFNWQKIVKTLLNALSLQRQIDKENQFTSDFSRFLEAKNPEWFPQKLLNSISFPESETDPNYYYINDRLDQIKNQVAILLKSETKEITGRFTRTVVTLDWFWTNELHVDSYSNERDNYIILNIYCGDTKSQGNYFFKSGKEAIVWPGNVLGFPLEVRHFMKFSHFNSGLFWYDPMENEYSITHTRDFFDQYAGRYQKKQWVSFERKMNVIAPGWREKCDYDEKLRKTNRTYFDLSLGIELTVYISYKTAQELDSDESKQRLATLISEIVNSVKKIVESQ